MKTRPTCVHYGGAGLWLTRPKQLSSNRSRRHNLLPSVAFNLRAADNQPTSCLNKAHFHQHNQICIIAPDIIIQWCHWPPPSPFQPDKLCTIVNNQISKSKVTKLPPFCTLWCCKKIKRVGEGGQCMLTFQMHVSLSHKRKMDTTFVTSSPEARNLSIWMVTCYLTRVRKSHVLLDSEGIL